MPLAPSPLALGNQARIQRAFLVARANGGVLTPDDHQHRLWRGRSNDQRRVTLQTVRSLLARGYFQREERREGVIVREVV